MSTSIHAIRFAELTGHVVCDDLRESTSKISYNYTNNWAMLLIVSLVVDFQSLFLMFNATKYHENIIASG